MGFYERDYGSQHFGGTAGSPMRFGLPQITPVVKWLLIINAAVFLIGLNRAIGNLIMNFFSVFPSSAAMSLQLWRLVSYQFLHGSFGHILFNMLGLFFLGPTLEGRWSSRKFLFFYLGCGAAGGLFYTILVWFGVLAALPMVGASGAILGMLAACAILFPHFVVFIFVFPVPIRIAALMFTVMYMVNIFQGGPNAGGDAAHLAGMAAGAVYVLYPFAAGRIRLRYGDILWRRRMKRRQEIEDEADRILEKVHKLGVGSLSRREKKILQEATKLEQMRNRL